MKTTNRYTVKADKIRSLKDIDLEKQRLKIEIMKTEQEIHSGYRNILQAFTLRNLASTVVNEITTTSNVVSKAIAIGKSFMAGRKKKKHDKLKAAGDDPKQ